MMRRACGLAPIAIAIAVAACATPIASTPPAASSPPGSNPTGTLAGPTLADIGGRKLEYVCRGSGAPVVILDAGLGNALDVWDAIVTRVSTFTTVCAYNRASIGRSDARPPPHGANAAVDDLHALVGALHLPPPYVVVGASFGGLDAQLFARRSPSETLGVVLVDAISPGWDDKLEAMLTQDQVDQRRAIPNGEEISNEEIRASERFVGSAGTFPDVPLVVLRHGRPFELGPDWPSDKVEALWRSLQEGLARLSPRSALLLAATSGHRIHQQQPDLVADAIHAVVDPSRWPPTEPPASAVFGADAMPADLGAVKGVLAFSSDNGIDLARLDGGHRQTVVAIDGVVVGEPSLDRTRRLLAYTTRPVTPAASGPQPDGASQVWIADLTTGKKLKLADRGQMPTLAPDGRRVAYTWHGETYLVGSDGSNLRDLGAGGCPVWSPNSRTVAMCTDQDEVFTVAIATGERHDLRTGAGPNQPSAWSPDGTSLALTSSRDGDAEIYVIDVRDAKERRLTTAAGNQSVDAWLPTGLLVTSSPPEADVSDWYLVDPASGEPRTIEWLRGVPNPVAFAPKD
jgi:pimeloyl-ACP methyl ester carboxylesterase